ncbi:hypothetical protein [Ktedonobacter robiniae]|uniref:Uncharacterized protein n=1 Tax=Ktedonobacter robiniae TaxID=2778365 RepID=A0ABQ3UT47_9CHLR|nr:hypothetical protein [Ktedonobacter robiniae]GHO55999.1 hypothetical protein KSB_44740 [Ktedonobacter robiniae]
MSHGSLVREEKRRYAYRFEIEAGASPTLLEGSDVLLRATRFDEEIAAQIVSVEDETLTLSVSRRLEVRVLESGEVVVDRARLYRKLKDAMLGSKAEAGLDRILLNEVAGKCPTK